MSTLPLEHNPHQIAAQAMVAALRQLIQSVDGYAFVSPKQRKKLSTAASLSDRFLFSVAAAVDASPDLAAFSRVAASELHDAVAFARAYASVADELDLVARGLRDTIAACRGDVAKRALFAYSIAKNLTRASDGEQLIPHVEEMKRALGRGPRRKNRGPGTAA